MFNNTYNPSGFEEILKPQNFRLLNTLQKMGSYTPDLAEKLNISLRKKGFTPALVSQILTQLELRAKAEKKFGKFASHMLFTRNGLEQSTRMCLSAVHAGRFRAVGCKKVADLGCGLGSDSMAIAALGMDVLAYEIDPVMAALATVNLMPFTNSKTDCATGTNTKTPANPKVQVRHGNVLDLQISELVDQNVDGIFADPARRDSKGRINNPRQWSPPLDSVLSWADQIPGSRLGVKLAPGIDYSFLPKSAAAQWTCIDGELVEAALWLGDLAHAGGKGFGPVRSALVMNTGLTAHSAHQHLPDTQPPAPISPIFTDHIRCFMMVDQQARAINAPAPRAPVAQLGSYLFEPNSAVIRAGLLAQLAQNLQAGILSQSIAYLTGDSLPDDTTAPFVQVFKILDVMPLKIKPLRQGLKAYDFTSLEIKKRGANIDPELLRKQLLAGRAHKINPKPCESLTLLATRIAGKHKAILASRL